MKAFVIMSLCWALVKKPSLSRAFVVPYSYPCHSLIRVPSRSIHGGSKSQALLAHDSGTPPKSIAIVGGGLAGLSTAYQWIEKMLPGHALQVTVMDSEAVGQGGASSVAGGYVHLSKQSSM
jgi:FAD dependent oxidoreductase